MRNAGAVDLPADVRDDDSGAPGREKQCMTSSDAATGPGDDGHPVVESQLVHPHFLSYGLSGLGPRSIGNVSTDRMPGL